MPSGGYSGQKYEKPGWSNTEIRINGSLFWDIQSFNEPDISSNTENVYGQGTTPIGYSKGNEELPTATMVMQRDGFRRMEKKIIADDPTNISSDVRDYPFLVTVTINPQQGSDYSYEKQEYRCIIQTIAHQELAQGSMGYQTTLTLNVLEIIPTGVNGIAPDPTNVVPSPVELDPTP